MIVRWGLTELPALAGDRPFVVASPRWRGVLDGAERWEEVPSHRIEVPDGVDAIVAIGGGSAIDTAKAASAATGRPLVSVPTTYSGAEWTPFFGVRDPERRMRGGGAGANLHAIVYEPELTLELPLPETVGTSLNALTLPAALRFNEPVAGEAIARFGTALGTDDPAARVEELARLGGYERLRDLGIPAEAATEVAEAAAARPGAKANPRPVTPEDAEALIRSIW